MYQYLEEKIKLNSFTFGFELEAILNDTEIPTPKDGEVEELDKDITLLRHKKLEPKLHLKEKFGGSYTYDGSIMPYDGRHTPFEYVSGVLPFTDSKINEFIDAMKGLKRKGVYTNKTCGFHIHFGFPNTTRKQLLWIKTVYLFDSLAQNEFEYFQSTQGPIPFWSAKYASVGDKKKISQQLAKIIRMYKMGNSPDLQHHIDKFFTQNYFTSKYNVLGIHEKYRTLEWRGPRGFLATGEDKDIINFVNTLRKFVKWLSDAEDTFRVVVDGSKGIYITRDDFFDMIEHHTQTRVQQFGVDIADQIDQARGNEAKAALAFEFFKTMNFSTTAATNYRKIANRIKFRYPKAWEMFEMRARREKSFPQHAREFIYKVGKFLKILHEESTNIQTVNSVVRFRQWQS